ncbi:hypothetical protein [Clostridium manihotivorum]|uniref:Uncharacterized protein n=1 Tax=Clostridium manihotivorum TaxID=2320868 RepID=A0A410DU52_9CLOT|nr:hypothetical protein [Clostridium manihotivorum]QAA32512.1 hypothetical protein C1I91_13195 [Clostridium manihotivorum]
MKKRKIGIVILLIILIILGYNLWWYINDTRLDIYTMTNDGRSISKDNCEYVVRDITDNKAMGKKIGKASYNGGKFYIFEKKGKDKNDCIIIMGVADGIAEEFVNKSTSITNR